ncbi:MAG TPA: hypothetical protein VKG24_29160 [Pseudolabrys sp.]|nr:hypothetical protein [Pseudolabrys sp.]
MSGLEVVVRPAILPNIRPVAPRLLAPEDNPEQGVATLGGSGGQVISLAYHFQSSMQREMPHYETQRTYDVDRIYQENDDGSINKDNYVDVERVKKMRLKDASDQVYMWSFATPPQLDNVSTIHSNQVRDGVAEGISGAG